MNNLYKAISHILITVGGWFISASNWFYKRTETVEDAYYPSSSVVLLATLRQSARDQMLIDEASIAARLQQHKQKLH